VSAPLPGAVTLESREVAHRYGARVGLERVSFTLRSPGVVAITGLNGAGKSTLLRILVGLLRPSAGQTTLTVDGQAVAPRDRRQVAGFASPELHFYEEFSAAENLAFAAEARGGRAVRAAAQEALARVGLAERAGDRVTAFSSGMKQRLRLAFALLHRPPLLILDEPGSHLDDEGRELVARLVAAQGRAGLMVVATNDEREKNLAGQCIELAGRGVGRPA
jgi:heme exporter protein A